MEAAAELTREESRSKSKHQIQPEYGDNKQADAGRDCWTRLAIPNSQAPKRTGGYSFSLFSWPRAGLATITGWSILCYMWWPYFPGDTQFSITTVVLTERSNVHTYNINYYWLKEAAVAVVLHSSSWSSSSSSVEVVACCTGRPTGQTYS